MLTLDRYPPANTSVYPWMEEVMASVQSKTKAVNGVNGTETNGAHNNHGLWTSRK